jgi:hypothetical protein
VRPRATLTHGRAVRQEGPGRQLPAYRAAQGHAFEHGCLPILDGPTTAGWHRVRCRNRTIERSPLFPASPILSGASARHVLNRTTAIDASTLYRLDLRHPLSCLVDNSIMLRPLHDVLQFALTCHGSLVYPNVRVECSTKTTYMQLLPPGPRHLLKDAARPHETPVSGQSARTHRKREITSTAWYRTRETKTMATRALCSWQRLAGTARPTDEGLPRYLAYGVHGVHAAAAGPNVRYDSRSAQRAYK